MAKKITDEQMNVRISINGGDKAQKALGDLESGYRSLAQKQEDLREAKQKLIAAGQKESEGYRKIENDLKEVSSAMKQNKTDQSNLRKEIGYTGLTMTQLKKEQRELAAQINSGTTKGTEDYERLKNEIKKVNKVILEQSADLRLTKEEMGDVSSMADQLSAATSDIFQGLRSGNIAQASAGLAVMKANLKGMLIQAQAFILTPIGATLAALGVILVGFNWFDNYNKSAREAMILTERLTGLQGAQADQARTQAKAMEKTFGSDFQETLKSADTISKNFGISFKSALDLIEDGLIKGGAANNEYFDSFREYSSFFAAAGYSAEEFKNIINAGFDLKIYSDKLPDALKEADLSLKEQTKTTRDAMVNAFGAAFTDEILEKVSAGELTTKEALQAIAAESERTNINVQQNAQLTADVFKGAGEDAGGALKIFEAINIAYEAQTRALTPLEQQIKATADANKELEAAQDSALKSDKYIAFTNDIQVSWTKFKTDFFNGLDGMLTGLLNADTAFRKFVYQSVQYVKTAFSLEDADWDKIGAKFDEMEEKKRKAAQQQREQEKQTGPPDDSTKDPTKKGGGDKFNAELEAAKNAAKKRMEAISDLEDQYNTQREDRLAKSNEAQAVLERDRAIQKAEALYAEQDLLEKIKAEHQIKIDEARQEDQDLELEKKREFNDRKRELENELRIQNKENDEQRELEKQDQDYEKAQEKLELDMEQLELEETQKNELRTLLKENHEASIAEIETRWAAIRYEKDRAFKEDLLKQEEDFAQKSARATENLENAKANAQQTGLRLFMSFVSKKGALYKVLFLLEKGAAIAQVVTQGAKSLAEITANVSAANAKAVSASPLTGGLPWVAINTALGIKDATAVKLNSAIQIATIGATAIKGVAGFEDGLYRDVTRTDGRRFKARNMGQTKTQIVTEPSYFRDYIAGESGAEMIIDNDTFQRLDPAVVENILQTRNSVRGYEDGLYKDSASGGAVLADPELKSIMAAMAQLLSNPVRPKLLLGYDDAEGIGNMLNEIDQSTKNGKITS